MRVKGERFGCVDGDQDVKSFKRWLRMLAKLASSKFLLLLWVFPRLSLGLGVQV